MRQRGRPAKSAAGVACCEKSVGSTITHISTWPAVHGQQGVPGRQHTASSTRPAAHGQQYTASSTRPAVHGQQYTASRWLASQTCCCTKRHHHTHVDAVCLPTTQRPVHGRSAPQACKSYPAVAAACKLFWALAAAQTPELGCECRYVSAASCVGHVMVPDGLLTHT